MTQLAFKKGFCLENGWPRFDGFYALFIMVRTLSGFVHVEIKMDNGLSFSSSENDGGVRFKRIAYSHPNRWKFIDYDLSKFNRKFKNEKELYNFCKKLKDKAVSDADGKNTYDWLGIGLTEAIPLGIEDKLKWYCSEIVSFVLGFKKYSIGPGHLLKKVKEVMGW